MTGWMDEWLQGNRTAAEQPVQCMIIEFSELNGKLRLRGLQWNEQAAADRIGPVLSGRS